MKKQLSRFTLAARTNVLAPEGAYFMLTQATALERKGISIVHFEIGQPDYPTPAHIVEAGVRALHEGKTKYTPPLGIYELREAIATRITKSRGIKTVAEEVAVTPSGKTALFAAMAAVLNPRDEVLYPDPGFPTYRTLIDFLGAVGKPVPLRESRHFSFDLDVFARQITKKTKLVILNSPSNPTGGYIPRADIRRIASLVKKTNAWVMTDEMYSDLPYTDEPYASIYSEPGMKERTILVHGFSKTYAMTGWRLGYLVVPERIIHIIDYLLTHTVGCTASFTQEAGIAALQGTQKDVKTMVSSYHKRRDYIVRVLNEIPGIHCEVPQGAFYVFPNISSFGLSSQKLALYLLHEAHVALLPGTAFGSYGEGYVRISYATSMSQLKEGVRRIALALAKLSPKR